MKCPKCKKNIEEVIVVSECSQRGYLEGNIIREYDDLNVEKTIKILCPECDKNIDKFIE